MSKYRDLIALKVVVLFISLCLPVASSANNGKSPAYIEGEIIVQLNSNVDMNAFSRSRASSTIGLKKGKLLSRRLNIWLLPYNRTSARSQGLTSNQDVLGYMRGLPDIKKAQFNHRITLRDTIPNDPRFDEQWALSNTAQSGGTAGADIDAPIAWDRAVGGTSADGDQIVVAVIDGGVDLDHEDLNLWKNNNEIANNDIDDDDNGYIDDFDGWNAIDSNGTIPNSGHGTHVSGIAAAIGNNGTGISGVNWNVSVLPIAGADRDEATVIEAYSYVLEMRALYNETNGREGAFIVSTNASFGVDLGDPAQFPIWCAIYDDLGAEGVLSVAATANNNINVDTQGDVPTTCASQFLISVTNTTDTDAIAADAAFGEQSIDLGAPGTNILSTLPNDTYGDRTGTSMAAPHVAGAIALLYAASPLENIQLYKSDPSNQALNYKEYLLNGVDQISALDGITVTGGRLNVSNAINNIPQVLPPPQVSLAWLVPVISLILN